MKIGGPKPPNPAPITPAKEGVTAPPSNKPSFAEALHAPNQSTKAAPLDAPRPLDTIVEALRSGAMDGNGAAQKMIDHVVAQRGKHLSPEMQQQLRDVLESALRDDPLIATKLRKLDEAAEAER